MSPFSHFYILSPSTRRPSCYRIFTHPTPPFALLTHLQVGHLEVALQRDRVLLGVGALDVDGDGRHGLLAAWEVVYNCLCL